jgi:hypothetical protein
LDFDSYSLEDAMQRSSLCSPFDIGVEDLAGDVPSIAGLQRAYCDPKRRRTAVKCSKQRELLSSFWIKEETEKFNFRK